MLLQDPTAIPMTAYHPMLGFTTRFGVDFEKVREEALLHHSSAAQVLLVQYPQKIFKFCEQLLQSYNRNRESCWQSSWVVCQKRTDVNSMLSKILCFFCPGILRV